MQLQCATQETWQNDESEASATFPGLRAALTWTGPAADPVLVSSRVAHAIDEADLWVSRHMLSCGHTMQQSFTTIQHYSSRSSARYCSIHGKQLTNLSIADSIVGTNFACHNAECKGSCSNHRHPCATTRRAPLLCRLPAHAIACFASCSANDVVSLAARDDFVH